MGYFSQRKKHARQNMFMLISLMVLAIVYFLLWFDDGTDSFFRYLRQGQFHFYLYNIFLLLYTLFHRHIIYAVFSIFLLFWNYGSLAQSARLFFNQEPKGLNHLEVTYQKGNQKYLPIVENNIKHQGKMELSPHLGASFVSVEKQGTLITVVNLDFSKKYKPEIFTALQNLEKFVLAQNGPVIIIGDFGIPSWDVLFRKFLINTRLSVKNKVLFTDGKSPFCFWFVPTLNILGFDNVGIKDIYMKKQKLHINLGY